MPTVTDAVDAAQLLQVHDLRNELFGHHLFAPDGWDVLLLLQSADTPKSAQAICDALDMYEATAERWIAVLESEGLVARQGPAVIGLTDRARHDLKTALAASANKRQM